MVSEVVGIENIDNALKSGKGVILLASHFGNWELLNIFLTANGYTGSIVGRRLAGA